MSDDELLYVEQAAALCGITRDTLNAYRVRGLPKGRPFPQPAEVRIEGGKARPMFRRGDVEEWQAGRDGPGTRTDLVNRTAE